MQTIASTQSLAKCKNCIGVLHNFHNSKDFVTKATKRDINSPYLSLQWFQIGWVRPKSINPWLV
jgi:hypothetical protein